ncbi:MAG: hypothetical protein HY825_13570 [Acidobacteria bacterium]|nr:hypothetical protein [Acidobacteriota bacterium]
MKHFTSAELAALRAAQESAMQDVCLVQSRTLVTTDLGYPTETWSDGVLVPCGFDPSGGGEIPGPEHAMITADAAVRLPGVTVIGIHDRIKLTTRYGEPMTPAYYDVVAPPEIGPSGVVVRVNRVEV